MLPWLANNIADFEWNAEMLICYILGWIINLCKLFCIYEYDSLSWLLKTVICLVRYVTFSLVCIWLPNLTYSAFFSHGNHFTYFSGFSLIRFKIDKGIIDSVKGKGIFLKIIYIMNFTVYIYAGLNSTHVLQICS